MIQCFRQSKDLFNKEKQARERSFFKHSFIYMINKILFTPIFPLKNNNKETKPRKKQVPETKSKS